MPDTKHLIPKPGLVVVDPATRRALPAQGESVQINSYWLRRMQDDDVAEAVTVPKAAAKTTTKPTSQE